jgi:hypothetical protein
MPHVYSTATNDIAYAEYHPASSDGALRSIKRKMVIRGGAGLPARRTLITRYGVGTEVSDDGLEWLLTIPAFQRHMQAGFIKHFKASKDGDKVAADMSQRDGSSQLVPNDFSDAELAKVKAATSSFAPTSDPIDAPTTKPRFKPIPKG